MNTFTTKGLPRALCLTGLLSMLTLGAPSALAEDAPVRVGLMLPATGT